MYTKFWTWINLIALILLSIIIYLLYFIISHYLEGTYSESTPLYLLGTPSFYLIILVVNAMIFIFDLAINQVLRMVYINPLDNMIKFK